MLKNLLKKAKKQQEKDKSTNRSSEMMFLQHNYSRLVYSKNSTENLEPQFLWLQHADVSFN